MSENTTSQIYLDENEYALEADAYIDFSEADKLDLPNLTKQNSTVFVTLSDVIHLIKDRCKEVNELLDVQEDQALIILNHYNWRKDLLESDWFENEEQRRKDIGIEPQEKTVLEDTTENLCFMCFDSKCREEFDSLECNHLICRDCWTDYIQYNVTRSENAFFWKCPMEGCNLVVPDTFNQKYIDTEQMSQYHKKMARAYTDTSKSLRWCPAINCQFGADVSNVRARAIECKCGWIYCFKCGQEDHRPCSCEVAEEWFKNGGSKEAMLHSKWLATHTKKCPKCKKPIEKNEGCNHMTCRNLGCGYEFCWLCFDKWDPINAHYTCMKYQNMTEEEKKAQTEEIAKASSNLDEHCAFTASYKKYEDALKSFDEVLKLLKEDEKNFQLYGVSHHQMEFLRNAWQTVRNAKRLLKWSYAYTSYISDLSERSTIDFLQEKMNKHATNLQGLVTGRYQEAKFSKYYAECKERILTSQFKCKQVSAAFLEKIEEFENKAIEEELKAEKMQNVSNGEQILT